MQRIMTIFVAAFLGLCSLGTLAAADSVAPLFASETIHAETPDHSVRVDVDVAGKQSIYLVVTDAGDGIACDFGNWIDPVFTTATEPIALTDLEWKTAAASWGEIRYDFNAEGRPMRWGSKPARGIGMHANSIVEYEVPAGAVRFQAIAALDAQGIDEGCGSTVRFFVYDHRPDLDTNRMFVETDNADKENEQAEAASRFQADRFFGSEWDRSGSATPPDSLRLPKGFHAELVYTVPLDEQGSWINLAVDDRGRLLASDQQSGLYRITLDPSSTSPKVERLSVDLGGCQGLLFHRGCLYAVVNGEGAGLYRVLDSNGDDQLDRVELLRAFDGAGEHGPHAVVAAPDGDSLFIIGGNVCFPGESIERSRVPQVWQEDRLVVRTSSSDGPWEPEENRIGGWVARTDLDGAEFELFAMGFRNPFDMAFNSDGELLTFDADMEWDTGTPWYRPCRINHVISGADFGWRAGQAKWPETFFDSFGSVVDIGLASPTGVTFGYGASFPDRYRRALFACDWSLGNIYAIHLTPDGSTYQGEAEPFVVGAPLPVTDIVIHPDGSLYFTVGGRGVTSALYRVSYRVDEITGDEIAGDEIAGDQPASDPEASEARQLRKRLEGFHSGGERTESELDFIWNNLSSGDRGIRHAARVALEHQPRERWQSRLRRENRPRVLIAASLVWIRAGEITDPERLTSLLRRIGWQDLSAQDRDDALRMLTVLLARHGRDGETATRLREIVTEAVRGGFPTGTESHDLQLAEILEFTAGSVVIDDLLDLLDNASTQESQIHYAMCLRDIDDGWSLEQRRRLLEWFQSASDQRGGFLFGDYLSQIHGDVVEKIDRPAWREALRDLFELPEPSDPMAELAARPIVHQWTLQALASEINKIQVTGNADRGREVFRMAACYRCHRYQGRGGMVGPDLTGISRRFNARDLLQAIVDPSAVISDQYRAVQIVTDDGRVLTGKPTDLSGNSLVIMNNVLDQSNLTTIKRDRVEQITWSEQSTMPSGLLDTFTPEQIADLLAFLTK